MHRLTVRELDAASRTGLVTQALDQLRRLLRDTR